VLGFAETLGATMGSFLVPAFVGLLIISAAARYLKSRYLAAFAIGLYLWFFSDTIGEASFLGANQGFAGGAVHLALWVSFAIGLLVLLSSDRNMFAEGHRGEGLGFGIPLLVAVAIGVHGFGEGAAIGATAAATDSTSLLEAFGGLSAASAFVLHKGLEPMMIGAAYWVYARDHATDITGRLMDFLVLTLAFSLPGIIGVATLYYLLQVISGIDLTYAFALGLGTSIYAALRLARPLFQGSGSNSESLRTAFLILLGFACLYLAASLHV
jgi:zinc transporter ZupT